MRQHLILVLVLAFAGALLLAGCATTNHAALERAAFVDRHPELTEQMAEALLDGQIMVGMSREMVQIAWGSPVRVETVDGEDDAVVHWIYGNYFVGGTITNLFFDQDGVLLRCEVKQDPTGASVSSPSAAAASGDRFKAGSDGSLQKGTTSRP